MRSYLKWLPLLALLSACGFKGDLYLPDENCSSPGACAPTDKAQADDQHRN